MKQICAFFLALCMVLSLTACGSTGASSSSPEGTVSDTAAVNACLTAIPEYTDGASVVTLCDGQDEVSATYTLTYDADGHWTGTTAVSDTDGEQTLENSWDTEDRRTGGVYSLMPDLLFIDNFYPGELVDTEVDYGTDDLPQSFSSAETSWGRAYDENGNVLMEMTEDDGLTYEYGDGFINEIYYTVDGSYGTYIEYSLDADGRVTAEKCLEPGESNPLWYATREYDAAGHLITRSIYRGGTELWGIYRFEY